MENSPKCKRLSIPHASNHAEAIPIPQNVGQVQQPQPQGPLPGDMSAPAVRAALETTLGKSRCVMTSPPSVDIIERGLEQHSAMDVNRLKVMVDRFTGSIEFFPRLKNF